MTEFPIFNALLQPLTGQTPTWVAYVKLATGVSYLAVAPAITEKTTGIYAFQEDGTAQFAGILYLGASSIEKYKLFLGDGPDMAVMALSAATGAPLAGLTLSWNHLYNISADRLANGGETPAFVDVGLGLYKFTPAAVAHETGFIDLSASAYPRYQWIDVTGTPPPYAAATTVARITAKIGAVIEALTPTSLVDRLFRQCRQDVDIAEAARTGAAEGVFRLFDIDTTGPRIDLGVMDPSAALVSREITVTVAYPANLVAMYGRQDRTALENIIEEDATKIRDALFSSGNLESTGHLENVVEIGPTDDSGDDIWFVPITVTAKFYTAQTLT